MAHHMPAQDHSHQTYSAADEKLFSKVGWRLLPLLIVCYVISYIDRINIGYAQLQMEKTLSFSDAAYAFGAGIFFVGYFIFEVPSNLLLEKMGARKTLLRILFLWGLAAAGMAFVKTPMQFYVLRFLLGAFEAGFFPGVILYLTYWYPSARRAKAIAIFMTGAALGKLLAGPMSGGIMQYMEGWHGLHGWQWLFIVEGLPACILGLVAFFTLKDRPEDADWLSPEQKRSLRSHLDNDTQVVATLGSKEGFANMAQAITAPGDVVLVPNPSYPIHAFGFLMAGGVIRSVPAEPTPLPISKPNCCICCAKP